MGGPAHLRPCEVAAVDHAERVQQLRPEFLGAAAVIAQGGERADTIHVAHHLAEIGLEAPIGHQHGTRHAVVLLDPLEDRRVFLEHRLADLQAVVRHHAGLEGQEVLRKDALGPVARNRVGIVGDAVERRGDGARRDAFGNRLLLEALQPLAEPGGAGTLLGKDARSRAEQHRRAEASACCHEGDAGHVVSSHAVTEPSRKASVKPRDRHVDSLGIALLQVPISFAWASTSAALAGLKRGAAPGLARESWRHGLVLKTITRGTTSSTASHHRALAMQLVGVWRQFAEPELLHQRIDSP